MGCTLLAFQVVFVACVLLASTRVVVLMGYLLSISANLCRVGFAISIERRALVTSKLEPGDSQQQLLVDAVVEVVAEEVGTGFYKGTPQ